jgi:paraquat-inducible protein A
VESRAQAALFHIHPDRLRVYQRLAISVLLVAGPFFLALGITLPLVRFETLYFFSDTPSLLGIIASLWNEENRLLATIVAAFSVVFPTAKTLAVSAETVGGIAADSRSARFVRRLVPVMSKWSMMDVLLVALVIVAAKTSGIASAFTQPGLWFYAGSTVAVTLCQALVRSAR